MTAHVGVGGVHKDVITIDVGVGGAWKTVTEVYVGVGGAWKLGYVLVNAQPAFATGTTSASLSFQNDGVVAGGGFSWLPGGTASDFDISLSGSGDTLTGPALSTWHNLGTTRTWSLTTSLLPKNFSGTYQIRHTASGLVLGSNTFEINLDGSL